MQPLSKQGVHPHSWFIKNQQLRLMKKGHTERHSPHLTSTVFMWQNVLDKREIDEIIDLNQQASSLPWLHSYFLGMDIPLHTWSTLIKDTDNVNVIITLRL